MVVAGHLIGEGGMRFYYSNIIRNFIYQFHMPAFFVITGITIGLTVDKYGNIAIEKILKRSMVLFTSYFFWSLAYMYILKVTFKNIDYIDSIIVMLTLRGRAPIWFLAALALAEIGFLILYKLVSFEKFKNINMYVFFTLIAILLCVIPTYYLSSINTAQFSNYQKYLWITVVRFFPSLLFVIFGFMFYKIIKVQYDIGQLIGACIISLILLLSSVSFFRNGVNMHTAYFGKYVYFYINALLGSAFVVILAKVICTICNPWLIPELGRKSLGIMVFHYPPYFMTFYYSKLLCKFVGLNSAIGAYLFCLSLSLLITYLMTKIFKEKTHYIL